MLMSWAGYAAASHISGKYADDLRVKDDDELADEEHMLRAAIAQVMLKVPYLFADALYIQAVKMQNGDDLKYYGPHNTSA